MNKDFTILRFLSAQITLPHYTFVLQNILTHPTISLNSLIKKVNIPILNLLMIPAFWLVPNSNDSIIKIRISSNLIGSFNTLFSLNVTAKLLIRECTITQCSYWTPLIGQLNKPITTEVPGFLTSHQRENSYYYNILSTHDCNSSKCHGSL